MTNREETQYVYILFERRNGSDMVIAVFGNKKAANIAKRKCRQVEPDKTVTFPIVMYSVDD